MAASIANTTTFGLRSMLIVLLASAGWVNALLKKLLPCDTSMFLAAKRRLIHR